MAASNDFLVFAGGAGANVLSQPQYAARSEIPTGVQSGQASSALFNKTVRQSSIIASMIGQFIANQSGANATDDGTTATLLANFIASIQATTRRRFTANTNFYVNPSTGNDTNLGLTTAAPFRTIQGAITAISSLWDFAGFAATINLADGTYTATSGQSIAVFGPGTPPMTLVGNIANPGNVVISALNGAALLVADATLTIGGGYTLQATGTGTGGSAGIGLVCVNTGSVNLTGTVRFGACGFSHVRAAAHSTILLSSPYSIAGAAPCHTYLDTMGVIASSAAVTVTGTPNFSNAFALVSQNSCLTNNGGSFTGSATGQRYNVTSGSIITGTGSTSFFPGSVAGTVDSASFSSYS